MSDKPTPPLFATVTLQIRVGSTGPHPSNEAILNWIKQRVEGYCITVPTKEGHRYSAVDVLGMVFTPETNHE